MLKDFEPVEGHTNRSILKLTKSLSFVTNQHTRLGEGLYRCRGIGYPGLVSHVVVEGRVMFLLHKRGILNSLDDPEDCKIVEKEDKWGDKYTEIKEESDRHTIFVVSLVGERKFINWRREE